MPAYGHDGDIELRGDLRVGQAVELAEEEGLAGRRAKAIQRAIDANQGFGKHRLFISADGMRVSDLSDGIEVGLLKIATTPEVEKQASRKRGEEGARLPDAAKVRVGEQLYEGLRREVLGILPMVESRVQPLQQPRLVLAIEAPHGGMAGGRGRKEPAGHAPNCKWEWFSDEDRGDISLKFSRARPKIAPEGSSRDRSHEVRKPSPTHVADLIQDTKR